MQYVSYYESPLGKILLASDDAGLSGLWFVERQRYFALGLDEERVEKESRAIAEAKRWLDVYFSGKEPGFSVPLSISGSAFRQEVCRIMLGIPYGKTMTYGEIAGKIAAAHSIPKMSARAVGGAVGHNPISIIIPCHRVVGASGSLTGYGGGIERKIRLLTLEGVDLSAFSIPRKGTAL